MVSVAAQQFRADRMKGSDPEIARDICPGQLVEAMPHLACRFVREGHRQDPVRWYPVRAQEIGDAIDERASFAATRPGEDNEWAMAVKHGLALGLV